MSIPRVPRRCLLILLLPVFLNTAVHAQDLPVGPVRWLPGDALELPAVESQDLSEIAPGGLGFLVVWQDQRMVLEGNVNAPGQRLMGNIRDIYAARLDTAGRLIDRMPILISNAGYIEAEPQVAWNGQSWLVAFVSTRARDFYNDEDLVAVRVAPDGRVLDPEPLLLEPETEVNAFPHLDVASDGTGWAVVWEAFSPEGVRGIEGTRVGPDGAVESPGGRPIHFDSTNTYAHHVEIAFATDRYLVVWVRAGDNASAGRNTLLVGKRLTPQLLPLDLAPFVIDDYTLTDAARPSLASDGTSFFVAWHERVDFNNAQVFGARVSRQGQVLDPAGIRFGAPQSLVSFTPEAAWDGMRWVVVFNQDEPGISSEQDLFYQRAGHDGRLLDPAPVLLAGSPFYEDWPAAVAAGPGEIQVVYAQSIAPDPQRFDVQARRILADGAVSPLEPVSIGLPRQSSPRMASHPANHLIVFLSDVSGETRVMAQRLDPDGDAVEPEPVVVASGPEASLRRPDVSWNGSLYLVVWEQPGGIFGRRVGADGTLVDPAPRALLDHPDYTLPAVAALGDTFLVVGTLLQRFTYQRRNYLQGVRVSGATGAPLEEPFLIYGGFARDPRVEALGSSWLVVWEAQVNHNTSYSSIRGVFVSPAGAPGTSFLLHPFDGGSCSLAGCGDDPDLAVQGDTALVVWQDTSTNSKIDGRLVRADGTLPGGEIEIVQAPNQQAAPAVTGTRDGWMVAWVDYRSNGVVDQPRGDVYVTRLAQDGTPLDSGGVPATFGPLPEEQPELAPIHGSPGSALLAYAALGIQAPVGYRIALRVIGEAAPPPPPPALVSLTLSPASVTGGRTSTGSVTLGEPAPAGGARVALSSSNTLAATVPASVTVPEGAITQTFPVSTRPVLLATTVTITASWRGETKTAELTVEPPVLSFLTLTPATFTGGCKSSTGKVTL